jgi:ATP-dependent Clp protease ATP-binding subunit ClpB
MTSNIGAHFLLEGIDEEGRISTEAGEMALNQLNNSFRPEFLNRLDEIVMFKPLAKKDIAHIIDLLLVDINKRLADREIVIELTEKAKDYVVEHGYEPIYGARPLKRYLQKHVETLVAKAILSGDKGRLDVIIVDLVAGKLQVVN